MAGLGKNLVRHRAHKVDLVACTGSCEGADSVGPERSLDVRCDGHLGWGVDSVVDKDNIHSGRIRTIMQDQHPVISQESNTYLTEVHLMVFEPESFQVVVLSGDVTVMAGHKSMQEP